MHSMFPIFLVNKHQNHTYKFDSFFQPLELITDAAVCVAVQEILAYILLAPLILCPENNMFSLF